MVLESWEKLGLLTFNNNCCNNPLHIFYTGKLLEKMQKMVKFQNPVPCVARTASLGNEFFAKCELLQEKEDKDMSSVWHFWKGLILPINQSVSIGWLIDWSRWIEGRNVKRFIKQRQCAHSCPKISIMCCKFGSKSKPFELLCCAQVKTFSIYNFCDFLVWIFDVWLTQMRKIANSFSGRILLLIVNWPFPQIAPFRH